MRSMFLALTILLLPIFLVSHATAEEAEPGYASFARTTIMARYADLGPSITFWRDVMGLDLDDLSPRTQPWLGAVVGRPGATCRIAHMTGHG